MACTLLAALEVYFKYTQKSSFCSLKMILVLLVAVTDISFSIFKHSEQDISLDQMDGIVQKFTQLFLLDRLLELIGRSMTHFQRTSDYS